MPTLDPPMSAAELLTTLRAIMDDVQRTDLDRHTKKIITEALMHFYPWIETHRRRREMN